MKLETTKVLSVPQVQDLEVTPIILSIVVPCYNEKDAVEPTIRNLERQLGGILSFEIIAVDDGSTDGTSEILNQLTADIKALRVMRHIRNRGYGGALKTRNPGCSRSVCGNHRLRRDLSQRAHSRSPSLCGGRGRHGRRSTYR